MKITYIFHVIGTLTMQHVERALESLRKQDRFHWDRFILFNASDLPSAPILALVDRSRFDTVEEYPDVPHALKSCAADWQLQMRQIGGADRYFCHKADFYLPPWVCRDFERISKKRGEFIVMFHKYDMKSRATLEDIQRFANMRWREGNMDPNAGTYQDHLGKLAIPFEQVAGRMDGTIHAYTDGVRALYNPPLQEVTQRWGVGIWFRMLDYAHPNLALRDPRFFACHMWHESPDRLDWNKNMSPNERF